MRITGEKVLFRRFQPEGDDARQMGELAFDNAFLGTPFKEICRCKQWFSDVVINDDRSTAIFRDRLDFPVKVICIAKPLAEV